MALGSVDTDGVNVVGRDVGPKLGLADGNDDHVGRSDDDDRSEGMWLIDGLLDTVCIVVGEKVAVGLFSIDGSKLGT